MPDADVPRSSSSQAVNSQLGNQVRPPPRRPSPEIAITPIFSAVVASIVREQFRWTHPAATPGRPPVPFYCYASGVRLILRKLHTALRVNFMELLKF